MLWSLTKSTYVSIKSRILLTSSSYADICRSIKLDNFTVLRLDYDIDNLTGGLVKLGVNARQVPLSKLLDKEVGVKVKRTLERTERVLKMCFPLPKEDGDLQG